MESFDKLYQRAADRKGGELALKSILTKPLSAKRLANLTDDRVLAELTKKVFMSGFVWRVVEQKWPNFEQLFFQFDIEKILMMPDEMLERKAQDPAIIRNFKKVQTIRDNALMLSDIADKHGSAAAFIAEWPTDNIIGLWQYLKKHGTRLGGNTGPYALRAMGKDTFLLTRDIEAYFRAHDLISGGLTTKTSLNTIQNTFNQWQAESGFSLQEISKLVAYGVGDNVVGMIND
ncbi:DNA-3-methyladenine glycosylase I [Catenovulum sp. SM1970]|uniref:DNA-3-methyladenine glycosylase I n=1 Tax=Marinifaba aquimaris TaxID=2741323 RepID=UPI001573EB9C|nr:DNA-3-methyladenine glycosylase I [Marinifaba aquimaris]NTS78583.1 DNA-3-methyladenine glycosylase I [Marinifaba aquimaris]